MKSSIHESKNILTRHSDTQAEFDYLNKFVLPPVDWNSIGQSAPILLKIDTRNPDDKLPKADIVILTWTSAEWFALDHIFLNSGTNGTLDREWMNAWLPYTRGASSYSADQKSGELDF